MKKFLSLLIFGCFGLVLLTRQNSEVPPASKTVEEEKSLQPGISNVRSPLPASGTEILEWAKHWESPATPPAEREQILSALKNHRAHQLDQMRKDPQSFLDATLSLKDYAALPSELQPFVARPFSAIGNINVQWATSKTASGQLVCNHQNTFQTADETLKVIPLNGKQFAPSAQQAVNGVALENQLIISPETVRPLDPSEVAAAKSLYPEANPDGRDPFSGDAHAENFSLIGGKVVALSSPDMYQEVEQRLTEQEPSFTRWLSGNQGGDLWTEDPQATPYQEDQIDVLYIRVDFSDLPGEPITQADLETTLASVEGHIDEYSYGEAGITFTVSNNFYRMPSTASDYATAGDNEGIQTDARALASADYTLANYDVIAVYFPTLTHLAGSQITYGGLANIGATSGTASQWINGYDNVGIILHEFGHNYGLYHANYHHPEQQLAGTYQVTGNLEYGDIFDTMGNGDEPEAHFNPLAKNQLQWIPDNKIAEATADGTWRIYRFDSYNARSNSTLALKVPMAGEINYWVGYRQLYTSSSYNLSNAAYVVGENMGQNRESSLIDMTPESQASESDDRKDAGLPVGGSYYDSNAGVTFETMATGGSEPNQWVDVQVTFDPRISLRDTFLEVDEQIGNAQIILQRSFKSAGALSIDYTTSDGTATANSDYYSVSGTVTWADGDSSDKIIYIPIRPDLINEGTEDFTLTLSNPVGGVLDAEKNTLSIQILDPGQRYTTFAPPFFNRTINSIVPLENGQVIVGGDIYAGIGDYDSIRHIARLNADGTVDTSFTTGSGFNDVVNTIVRQDDGKLLVGGDFSSYNGTSCGGIIRLLANGTVDSSFAAHSGTGANGPVYTIALESDGGILVGGEFSSYNGTAIDSLVRLNSTGARNTASPLTPPFTNGFQTEVRDIAVRPDGKIWVGGSFSISSRKGIARLFSNGTLDTTFDQGNGTIITINGIDYVGRVYTLHPQNDGSILVGGNFSEYDGDAVTYFTKIENDGSRDPNFITPAFNNIVHNSLSQPLGRIIPVGRYTSPSNRIMRLTPTGSADSTFLQSTGAGGSLYAITEDAAGQLFVGGNFYHYQSITTRPVIRIAGGVSPYQLWVKENFTAAQITSGVTDPEDDPDNDDISNLAELAMGTDPNVVDAESLFAVDAGGGVTIVEDGGQQYLQISLNKPVDSEAPWYSAQFSGDLDSWSPASPTPGSSEIVILENSDTTFTVRDTVPISPTAPRFGRIVLQTAE
ncbi:Calx-beta domain-containing protein [Kiritimatiellaeota bacterium B1221]|nr:Calx-beta domain-containing protein [Kiritimatiellaeota bacterium B1221]